MHAPHSSITVPVSRKGVDRKQQRALFFLRLSLVDPSRTRCNTARARVAQGWSSSLDDALGFFQGAILRFER